MADKKLNSIKFPGLEDIYKLSLYEQPDWGRDSDVLVEKYSEYFEEDETQRIELTDYENSHILKVEAQGLDLQDWTEINLEENSSHILQENGNHLYIFSEYHWDIRITCYSIKIYQIPKQYLEFENSENNSVSFNNGIAIGENSVAFNGGEAIGTYAFAENEGTLAGCLGFYIESIYIIKDADDNTTGGEIYLSDSETPIIPERLSDSKESTSISPGYTLPANEDTYLSVESNGYYHWPYAAKITAIDGNKITYEGIIEPTGYWESGQPNGNIEQQPFCFFIATQPKGGIIKVGSHTHAEGWSTFAAGDQAHAEGYYTQAISRYSHTEGMATIAGYASHAEGLRSKSLGLHSHAEGFNTESLGPQGHTEGYETKVHINVHSGHAEGFRTSVSGNYGHAEGQLTKVSASSGHAEGKNTDVSGNYGHAEGVNTKVLANQGHAEGRGTIASKPQQHVQGKYNIKDESTGNYNGYAHIVGNGTAEDKRSDAYRLDWNGNGWFAGKVTVSADPVNDMDLVTLKYLNEKLRDIESTLNNIIKTQESLTGGNT